MANSVKDHLRTQISRMIWLASHKTKRVSQVRLRSDDVFVVSYPRSGNSWVRFLFANLMRGPDAGEVDFHTLSAYVPELGRHDDIIARMNGPRVIKSHAMFSREFCNVIYIVRDARDVYVSYYHFLRHRLPEGMGFGDFLASMSQYVPSFWSDHVDCWLLARRHPHLLLVRYEDMVRDCAREFERMVEFAGIKPTSRAIADAVRLSSFEEMRRSERARGRPYQAEAPSQFVRRGEVGGWRAYFGGRERRVFPGRDKETLVRVGYANDADW